MKNLTPEMIEKAKAVKSAEEILALAKDNDIEMTADEAATYFEQLNPKSGELNDDDLDAVAGGACGSGRYEKTVLITSGQTCHKCGTNKGKLYFTQSGFDHVYCEKCNCDIAIDDGSCTYEFID